jgi:hypothetical protein
MATLYLGACASMSKDECRAVDWRTVGYEDGVAGQPGDHIGEHRRACADYGIRPDLAAYQSGRTEGLREYCQSHNGFRHGANGDTYFGTCPADLAPAFETAYDAGRELYVRTRRVTDIEDDIARKRYSIRHLEDRIAESAFDVIEPNATVEERASAVIDTKQAAERIGRLKAEIAALEKDRARYAAELEAYRSTVAAVY